MPSLGADMQEGTLIEWSVKPGDRLKRGDILCVVRTEKADTEVEVFHDAVVEKLLAKPGETLPVGGVMAILRKEGEARALEAPEAARPTPPPTGAPAAEVIPFAAPQPASPVGHVRASPLARRTAQELGVELASVMGTGPHGAIAEADIRRSAEALKQVGKEAVKNAPPPRAGMRRAIAAAMARSNREIPHYYLETRIDLSRLLKFLETENQKRSVQDRILSVVPLLKAVARALQDVPELNAYWVEDQLQRKESIHIGLAISLRDGGLVVPAIKDVGQKNLDELMQALRDVITRARGGRLRSSELTDATITVTNLGDLGVETVHGVIYPPQVALVGFGRIIQSPWVENAMLGIRPVVAATLAGDHRATDGHCGAQFLTALNGHLQSPEKL
jgi:pyruvate dehydrogenase E2 component (dihydrolipoamide acetyltransferase)